MRAVIISAAATAANRPAGVTRLPHLRDSTPGDWDAFTLAWLFVADAIVGIAFLVQAFRNLHCKTSYMPCDSAFATASLAIALLLFVTSAFVLLGWRHVSVCVFVFRRL